MGFFDSLFGKKKEEKKPEEKRICPVCGNTTASSAWTAGNW